MYYSAQFTPAEEGGFVVTFRDLPEAITQGDDKTEAREMAADVLLSTMDFYFDDKRPVPLPSKPQKGEELVELPAAVYAKVLLLNEMLAQGISNVELARRLGTRAQEVQRIVNLHHNTKIDTISAALHELGKRLTLGVQAA
ncbi:type II toxin-antitoxin system HicB family antitoxin [Conchiformibius steedae]|uniref:Type II toxin-antitoxin system HicB family antitoxin n=1 Tax=Conchiformibius steedae TaxID=153493 RepID=A0A3P2A4Z8_9NEIS|nr:type II toxin-antitoxin system HicB family antitoxin [Conchiformibius steedae]RRD90439.1 type II toxin-antitoxin system HicB family antitoxin [Conchiformibius steedae]